MTRKGFTLAEVLITLGIVGIVAAYTIPILISNSQKTAYVENLKKAYNGFNQALQQLSNDYGCVNDLVCTGLFASGTTSLSLGTVLVKYFKVANDCGVTENKGCFPSATNLYYDGTSTTIDNYDHNLYDTFPTYRFITTDGMSFLIFNMGNNCGYNNSSGSLWYLKQICGEFYVDVNGLKGPNNLGRDTFKFWISNGKGAQLYPQGGIDDGLSPFPRANWWNYLNTNFCFTTTNKNGNYCTGRVIEKGWVMDY